MTRPTVAILRALANLAYAVGHVAERVDGALTSASNRLVERHRVRTSGSTQ